MASDDYFTADVERALRRARSTGDLDEPTRPMRHLSAAHRRSEGQPSTSASANWPRHQSVRHANRELRMPAPLSESPILEGAVAVPLLPRQPDPVYRPGRTNSTNQAVWEDLLEIPAEEVPPHDDEDRRAARPPPRGWLGKVLVFFGQAGPNARARSQLISMVWTLGSGLVQVRCGVLQYMIITVNGLRRGISPCDSSLW